MVRLACALLLAAVAACFASERIVGGNPTTVYQYPSIVQLQSQVVTGIWTQTCAGSILTRLHVLTAARCVSGRTFNPSDRRIIAGSSYPNTGGYRNNVVRAVLHPSYTGNRGSDGDIAIIQLENPLAFSDVVKQATIVGQGAYVPDRLPTVQAGWGVTLDEIPNIRASQLQEANVFTVNNAECAAKYGSLPFPRKVTTNMLCAAASSGTVGGCVGDAGGPLYFGNIVVGVISFGLGCRNTTFPDVHTAISSYTNWIIQNAV